MRTRILLVLPALFLSEFVICAKLGPIGEINGKSRLPRHELFHNQVNVADHSSGNNIATNMLPLQGSKSGASGANSWPKLFNFHPRGVRQQQKSKEVLVNYHNANVAESNNDEALAISLSDYEKLIRSGADVQFSADGQKLELVPHLGSLNFLTQQQMTTSQNNNNNNSGSNPDQFNELQLSSAILRAAYAPAPKIHPGDINRNLIGTSAKKDRLRSGLMTILRQLANEEEIDDKYQYNPLVDSSPQEQALQSAMHSIFQGPGENIAINRFFTAILENGRVLKRIRRINHLVARLMANFSPHSKKPNNSHQKEHPLGKSTMNHQRPIRQESKDCDNPQIPANVVGTTLLNGRRFKTIPLVDNYGIFTGEGAVSAAPEISSWIKATRMQQLHQSINSGLLLHHMNAGQHLSGRFASRFLNKTISEIHTPSINSIDTSRPPHNQLTTRAPPIFRNTLQPLLQPQNFISNNSEGACYYPHQHNMNHHEHSVKVMMLPSNVSQTTISSRPTTESSTIAYNYKPALMAINDGGNSTINQTTLKHPSVRQTGKVVDTTTTRGLPTRSGEVTTALSTSSVVIYASIISGHNENTSTTENGDSPTNSVNNTELGAREQYRAVGNGDKTPVNSRMIMIPVDVSNLNDNLTSNNNNTHSYYKSTEGARGHYSMTADFNVELNSTKSNDSDEDGDEHVVIETKQPFSIQPLVPESLSFTREMRAKENSSHEPALLIGESNNSNDTNSTRVPEEPVIIELDENSITVTDVSIQDGENNSAKELRGITSSVIITDNPKFNQNDGQWNESIRTSAQQLVTPAASKMSNKLQVYGKSITDSIEDLQTSHSDREFWPEET